MAKLQLTTIQTLFPNGKIDEKLDLKRVEGNAAKLRSEVIRRVSDVISENIGIGKKITKAQAKEYEKSGAFAATAPDSILDQELFEKRFGVKVEQSEFLKGVATAELKTETPTLKRDQARAKAPPLAPGQSRLPEAPELTAISIGPSEKNPFRELYPQLIKLQKEGGAKAAELILTPGFEKLRKQLVINTKAKLENILILDIQDVQKGAKDVFRFFPTPFSDKTLFNDENLLKHLSLAFNFKSDGRIRLQAKPTELLRKKIFKNGIDLTEKIRQMHQGKLSQTILNTVAQRLKMDLIKTPKSDQQINDTLSLIVAFAKEFEKGGFTPYQITQRVTAALPNAQDLNGKLNVRSKKVNRVASAQRFISGVQLTQLVQKRLGKTMERFGNPEPPDLKNRSGRFRNSVEIIASYRKNIIAYRYNPLYDSLAKYGYKPDEQVGKATREVVQTLFGRAFNIIRG